MYSNLNTMTRQAADYLDPETCWILRALNHCDPCDGVYKLHLPDDDQGTVVDLPCYTCKAFQTWKKGLKEEKPIAVNQHVWEGNRLSILFS